MSGTHRPVASSTELSTLLVAERTRRPDALNNFRMYTGGWNLSSSSYFASAGYTGMPLFAISLIWIFMGFTFAIVVSCMYICWKDHLKSNPDFGRCSNWMILIFMIAFTVVTIAGCGALFTGTEELHSDLSTVFSYLTTQVAQAANASIESAPPIAIPDATHAARVVANVTNSTSISVHHTLDQIRFWLIILGSSVLGLSLIGLVFVACRIDFCIFLFVIIGWAIVVGTWFLCGIFLLIYAVFGDTCAAMEEWSAYPRNGTSFDLIMRCESNHTKIKGRRPVTHTSIGQLPRMEEDEIQFPEYKFLSDLSHVPSAADDEIPFPEYDSPSDDDEIPFPEYMSPNDINNTDYEPYPIDDPNDANDPKNEFWVQFTIQRKDYFTWENESCSAMRASFAPILETIVQYDYPNICRNTLWVTLAMVTLSGGSMFQICLWIIFTRRSTMRPRSMVPVQDQLPFYAFVYQEPVQAPAPAPVRASMTKKDYAGYDPGGRSNSAARARRTARLQSAYRNPTGVPVSTKSGGRRRK